MSRSKTEIKEKIAHRYFEWSSEDGQFKYFDKEAGKSVKVPLPFRFVPLDVLGTIKGFNDQLQCGVYSNEVKRVGEQELVVKTFKNGEFCRGLYKDIKGKIKDNGGKYGNSVYIGYKLADKMVICNLQLTGAAMSSFIEYTKEHKDFLSKGSIIVKTYTDEKKGATKYTKPVFEFSELSPESNAACIKLDEELQVYLDEYLNGDNKKVDSDALSVPPDDDGYVPDASDAPPVEDLSDLPF